MEKFVVYSGQDRKQNRPAYFVNLGKVLENVPSFLFDEDYLYCNVFTT